MNSDGSTPDLIPVENQIIVLTSNLERRQLSYFITPQTKIVGILLDRSWSHDAVKITVFNLGVEICIGRVILFETGGEQSKMADDELIAMDLSQDFFLYTLLDSWLYYQFSFLATSPNQRRSIMC